MILYRIDDRFIHGQVVVGWVRYLGATELIVINDRIAAEPFQRELYQMVVPEGTAAVICAVEDAIDYLNSVPAEKNVIVLLGGPDDVSRLISKGVNITNVNVGNMAYSEGKTQVTRSVSLSPEEKNLFCTLSDDGVRFEVRAVPTDSPVNLIQKISSQCEKKQR
jgi:mannose/fructose/sorbose-specific phosphotransferase system IIB component